MNAPKVPLVAADLREAIESGPLCRCHVLRLRGTSARGKWTSVSKGARLCLDTSGGSM
jgi:hypothetical protein